MRSCRRLLRGAGAPACTARRQFATTIRSHSVLSDRRDTEFVLHELLAAPREDATAILNQCDAFAAAWAHADPILDQSPPQMVSAGTAEDGQATVTSHPLTREWIDAFREQGFAQMSELGLPFTVQCAAQFTLGGAASSNVIGYFVLTRCAADLLEAHGSGELKARYLEPLRSAQIFGTMALSEAHAGALLFHRLNPMGPNESASHDVGCLFASVAWAGSSLATIRTMATPDESGTIAERDRVGSSVVYRIRGDKMWCAARAMRVCAHACGAARAHGENTWLKRRSVTIMRYACARVVTIAATVSCHTQQLCRRRRRHPAATPPPPPPPPPPRSVAYY